MSELEKQIQIYYDTNKIIKAYHLAFYLAGWDSETGCPIGTIQSRSDALGTLSELGFKIRTSKEYNDAIDYLYEHREELDPVLKHEIIGQKEDIEDTKKFPIEEVVELSKLENEIHPVYVQAKLASDFNMFKPYLEKMIGFQKRKIEYISKDNQFNNYKGYDVLLNSFEKDMTMEEYDKFFGLLKEKLVPFIKKVTAKKLDYDREFTTKVYPKEQQAIMSEYLRDVMDFDRNYTILRESEHPFTSGNGNKDVRITTHYYEDCISSSMLSIIHEMGHGLYELHVSDEIDATMSGGGASMAMHESQSRFMENMIGRSKAFWDTHYAKLQSIFPEQLGNVKEDDFYKYMNEVQCSLIRTEADELTYPLHIMVRYEIEKKIFNGSVTVDELPSEWNRLYKEYLGIDVPNDKAGVLQDIHWALGSFGYFPTYALGSAYAAQFYNALSKDVDVDKAVRSGNLKEINAWLKENIHKYGSSLDPKDIILKATGEEFNPNYYIDYLINKYSKIYDIK